jgi:hypothetical protein
MKRALEKRPDFSEADFEDDQGVARGVGSLGDQQRGRSRAWQEDPLHTLRITLEVPHPETLGIRSRAMANAAGVRSYEAFADLAKCVAIEQDSDEVIFTPTRKAVEGSDFYT